jgi:hypothetical protein
MYPVTASLMIAMAALFPSLSPPKVWEPVLICKLWLTIVAIVAAKIIGGTFTTRPLLFTGAWRKVVLIATNPAKLKRPAHANVKKWSTGRENWGMLTVDEHQFKN